MPYGYQQWLKYEGTNEDGSPRNVRAGALNKVLEIIENLKYPRPGWGLIKGDELALRVRKLKEPGSSPVNPEWDHALQDTLDWMEKNNFLVYCKDRIDPKDLVSDLKKQIKALEGNKGASKSEPDSDESGEEESDD